MTRYILLLAHLVAALASADVFEVELDKPLWFGSKGSVEVGDEGISFRASGKKAKTVNWAYGDIQFFERISPTEFRLLSYEDVAWKLGRDRSYRFEITSGEISDELFERVTARIARPAGDRIAHVPASVLQELPVKHLTTFGGSEGTLYVGATAIAYLTKAEEQSREWILDRDVHSVWSSDPYRLEVHAYEATPGAFRKPRVYKFALKRPLDPEFYRSLKLRLYDVDRERDLTP